MSKQYFGTDGIRGKVGSSVIHPEFVLRLGWAVGMVLGQNGKVLIGKDTRISGYMFEAALEAGLSAAGVNIHLLGPMPTPAVAYLTRTLHADAGIVISASHNGYEDNGIKFFNSQGMKLDDEIELAIEAQLEKSMVVVPSSMLGKASRLVDGPGRYIEFCKNSVGAAFDLKGLRLVLDCANGATYYIAPSVFTELEAIVVDIAVEPDGFNINEGCGSTSPQHLQKTVLRTQSDMGIAFDGDGDRVIMVDHCGEIVDGDELLWIIARYHQAIGQLKGGVVGTVMSNLGLALTLNDCGIPFERSQVGDRHVLEKMQSLGWSLGGESSGHILCLNQSTTGDGIVSALQVLAAMRYFNKDLHTLKKEMHKMPQVMINIPLNESGNDPLASDQIQSLVQDIEKQFDQRGRVLLRRSGTESLVRVMVQGDDAVAVQHAANVLSSAIHAMVN